MSEYINPTEWPQSRTKEQLLELLRLRGETIRRLVVELEQTKLELLELRSER